MDPIAHNESATSYFWPSYLTGTEVFDEEGNHILTFPDIKQGGKDSFPPDMLKHTVVKGMEYYRPSRIVLEDPWFDWSSVDDAN